jgi:hypothetical protein
VLDQIADPTPPKDEKAEIAFQSGGKILTALTRFE